MQIYVKEESYFEYLLKKSRCWSAKNIEIMNLLEKQIYKFSGGDSSVSKVRAQSLMDTIVYILSLYFKQYQEEKAIEMIKDKGIEELYNQGLLWIKYLMDIGRDEVNKMQFSMVVTDYNLYNETLRDGLTAFINNYNYEYNALDNVITYDYPLLCDLKGYVGIERFYQYLMYIKMENTFCYYFKQEFIKDMLCSYKRNYQNFIFNISELILTQMLLSAIINYEETVIFDVLLINQIYKALENKSKIEILHLLTNAYYNSLNRLNIDNQKLIQYLYRAIASISSRVYYGCLHKTLEQEVSYVKTL